MGDNFYPSPETLRTSYVGYLEDIRRSKNQQWLVANYSLLIQAAIFTGVRYIDETSYIDLSPLLVSVFIVTSILIAAFSLLMIWSYYYDIKDYRDEKNKFALMLNIYCPKERHEFWEWVSKWGFLVILCTVVFVAALFNILHIQILLNNI